MLAENASHVGAWMFRSSVSEKAKAEEPDVITGRGFEPEFNMVRNRITEFKLRKHRSKLRLELLTFSPINL